MGDPLVERLAQVTTVLAEDGEVARYRVEGMLPRAVALPGSEEEVTSCLRVAGGYEAAVIPRGGGTHMGLGTPPRRCDLVLSLERLNRMVEYVPEDLTVTVEAGMRLADLQALTASHGQAVPLEGGSADGTVGGAMATAAIGPRRMVYGGPRDILLGTRVALADGRVIKTGGRVVKNVAGYDMNKLLVGSLGTLGILTELTLKLRPLPACRQTLYFPHGDLPAAMKAAEAVLNAELLPTAVTLLSPGAARRLGLPGPVGLAVELAESEANVSYQADRVKELAGFQQDPVAAARGEVLTGDRQEAFWEGVRNSHRDSGAACRIRISTVISALEGQMLAGLSHGGVDAIAHVGAGSLFLYGTGLSPADVTAIQERAAASGGAAVLEEAPAELKRQVEVWGPPRPEWRLMGSVKKALDPAGLLNPGRFVGGI